MEVNSIIEETLKSLNGLETILYPTDTVWGIGGDATQSKVVEKVFALKKRSHSKTLICLVDSEEMLKEYVSEIPQEVFEYLRSEQPTTIIYQNPKGLAHNLIASDATVAIRIPKHEFSRQLVRRFGKPLISTSANVSGSSTPFSFHDITQEILEGVDYIVPLEQDKKTTRTSRILKINSSETLEILRS